MLIHGFVAGSRVNGPGVRAVVYFQGCTLGCPGCWNTETHAFTGVEQTTTTVDQIAERVVSAHRVKEIEGVTFSGGEPMQQAPALHELIGTLRQELPDLSFGMYSGYSSRELESGRYWTRSEISEKAKQYLWNALKSQLDFAVLGRYVASRRTALPLRTSPNQELRLFTDRYKICEFRPLEVEVHIQPEGLVQITGFPIAGSLL